MINLQQGFDIIFDFFRPSGCNIDVEVQLDLLYFGIYFLDIFINEFNLAYN